MSRLKKNAGILPVVSISTRANIIRSRNTALPLTAKSPEAGFVRKNITANM